MSITMTPFNKKPRLSMAVGVLPISLLAPRFTRTRNKLAVVIPGDSVLETTTVGGTVTFFNIYQNVLVARILLSWFPGLQNNALVRPLITVCDPYLGLFRNVVPPIFGLDLSPVVALLLLQALSSVRILSSLRKLRPVPNIIFFLGVFRQLLLLGLK